MGRPSRFSPEVRERAVRLVMEQRPAYPSEWAALQAVATKLGMTAETLRTWVRQAERDTGQRPGLTTSERERLAALERENRELKRTNEILKTASVDSMGQGNTIVEVTTGGVAWRRSVGRDCPRTDGEMRKAGHSISEISRAVGSPAGSIFSIFLPHGGYYQAPQRRRTTAFGL